MWDKLYKTVILMKTRQYCQLSYHHAKLFYLSEPCKYLTIIYKLSLPPVGQNKIFKSVNYDIVYSTFVRISVEPFKPISHVAKSSVNKILLSTWTKTYNNLKYETHKIKLNKQYNNSSTSTYMNVFVEI
jgi:hypothetical protein